MFQRGHRIRLDISSSNFPKYDVNPNSGESAADAREKRIALNTVHLSAAHPSSVTLCVAAPGTWRRCPRMGPCHDPLAPGPDNRLLHPFASGAPAAGASLSNAIPIEGITP
ncbi:CocE/NonD family hydrolase C-terminal non-catalytic domain-containing protein [Achromobacter xylosoxidans]